MPRDFCPRFSVSPTCAGVLCSGRRLPPQRKRGLLPMLTGTPFADNSPDGQTTGRNIMNYTANDPSDSMALLTALVSAIFCGLILLF
jgi:hypothetical protein